MKNKIFSVALVVVSLVGFTSKSFADDVSVPVQCGPTQYELRAYKIEHPGNAEKLIYGIPFAVGVGLTWAGFESGDGYAAGVGLGLVVGGFGLYKLDHGVRTLVGKIDGSIESDENIVEAENVNQDGNGIVTDDAAIKHTRDRIVKERHDPTHHSVDQVKQAILLAANSGELCKNGDPKKLLEKGNFRKVVYKYLKAMPAAEDPIPPVASNTNPGPTTDEKPANTPVNNCPPGDAPTSSGTCVPDSPPVAPVQPPVVSSSSGGAV